MTVLPDDDHTIDDLLASVRTRNRYATYDMAAAGARLRARQTARHRPPRQRTTDTAPLHTEWTTPEEDESTPDADRAWWDLNAVCLLALGPDADEQLAAFITSRYADKAGALVFACLLHLSGDSSGARFWWRFAAGFGHPPTAASTTTPTTGAPNSCTTGSHPTCCAATGPPPPSSAHPAWNRSTPTSSTSSTRRSAPFRFPHSGWSASYGSSPHCCNRQQHASPLERPR
ncbi:hypothetical protein ACFVY4_32675 [Streptomyces sp. NPDC058299]|uniref:hypothetical protein n=1 Tax=Streptomyces sp. NPDC058299 TaxID=3346435 RepID=UPI0036EA1CA4